MTATQDTTTTAPPADERMSPFRKIRIALLIAIGGVLIVLAWSKMGGKPQAKTPALPVVKDVPDFSLIGRDGRTVNKADLLGHVWVADFIFTTCAGPCPVLSLRMRSLQKSIREFDGRVKLVSFSVDPEYDQPPILRAYAKRHDADPNLWWFLTSGDEDSMHEFVKSGFLQAVAAATGGGAIIHSTQFVIVDRKGRIRSWYDGLEVASKPLILRDIEQLLNEPAD